MTHPSTTDRPLSAHGGEAHSCAGRGPELLAPAGDWACVKAAVENGADAVYFGLDKFNARMRAANFTEADLPELMAFLHRRGVRGYVTLNTLVFEDELNEAARYLRTVIAAGVDAAIVQDVGICRLIRELSPDFPIHASTQMSVTSVNGVQFTKDLGCRRVVVARELSIRELDQIRQGTLAGGEHLPLEVFVHGALCVAYSGQCLTSESLGGRSANRGECAQACRMPYELVSDGKPVPLGDRRYLLSPQDLAGLSVLPDLVRAGVSSLKIEGRLKTPEYVANVTQVYRTALDQLTAGQSEPHSSSGGTTPGYDLEMAFSRGLYTGWLSGNDNQQLVHARFGKKRGVYLGTVTRVLQDRVIIHLEAPLKPGDGIVFDAGRPDEQEEGGRVYELQMAEGGPRTEPQGGRRGRHRTPAATMDEAARPQHALSTPESVSLTFGNNAINFSRVHVGDRVWKTSDPALEKQWRQSYEGDTPRYRRPIDMEVHGMAGRRMTVIARDELGHIARVESACALEAAIRQPLSTERLKDQLGRLGGSPFQLGALTNALEGAVMLPVSELNRLRRRLVSELEQQRLQPKRWTISAGAAPPSSSSTRDALPESTAAGSADMEPELIVLVRSLPQLEAVLRSGIRTIYCDFENPKAYREAVRRFRDSAGRPAQSALYVAPPRIFKPGEDWQLEQVRSCNADGYLVRNYDHLRFFRGERCVGDFSLNIANHLSADYFLAHFDLERVTASYDLNVQQLEALLNAARPGQLEVTLHQHMPMFHMEHCVFCAFLSKGRDYRDCGRPCDQHRVALRDRVGAEHPVKADVGCRNTVFNALAQTGAEYVDRMLALGLRQFRIEFLNESPDRMEQTIRMYQQLLRGEISGARVWQDLKLINQLGVTRGQIRA